MRVIVTGARGQVGSELSRFTWPGGWHINFLPHQELDIVDPAAAREKIAPPVNVVINAAAYTAVDRAESEPELAYRVNVLGAQLLASRCEALKIPLIHLSTDYVFGRLRRQKQFALSRGR
jgi:dTDP-4-dehydrorhamnose reductase